jgi:uncharacterized protein (DUF1015 family)
MAEILPFQAWRYSSRHPLSSLVTQPYDKITPAMQERYYAASPYNLVRIILGKPQSGDDERNNVYTRAAKDFVSWRKDGVLQRDEQPSIYFYSQLFTPPGEGITQHERRGFIALGRLHDYAEKVVFRHEQTLAKPKADRLNLLRATRAHFGQIFMLYSDPAEKVEAQFAASTSLPPTACVCDEYGVEHRLWQISDTTTIAAVQKLMSEKSLIIADGHHRYETALAYRDERRKGTTVESCAPYEKVMMTFINMDSPGLLILPTHRVISGIGETRVAKMMESAISFFSVTKLTSDDLNEALEKLRAAGKKQSAILVITRDGLYLLNALSEQTNAQLASLSAAQRSLDVNLLHKLLLERELGLSEDSIRNQENISYYREAEQAAAQVRNGKADVAFLLNPVRAEQMRDIALAGEVMPQKSTDFYPKLLSGLTIYALE